MSTPFLKINDQLLECSYYSISGVLKSTTSFKNLFNYSISGVLFSISTFMCKTPLFRVFFYIFCRNMYCALSNAKNPNKSSVGIFIILFLCNIWYVFTLLQHSLLVGHDYHQRYQMLHFDLQLKI